MNHKTALILGSAISLAFAGLGVFCLLRGQDVAGGYLIFGGMCGGTLTFLRNV
jgi:hypothetical protein